MLRAAPREVWITCLYKLLTSYGYYSVASVFVLYLTEEHDFDDRSAARLYGAWGAMTTLAGVSAGYLIDSMGIYRSFVLGSLVACLGMFSFALAFKPTMLYVGVLVLMPLGVSLGSPVTDIACKRFTYSGDRKFMFSVIYSAMNVGGAFAGLALQGVRSGLDAPHGGRFNSHGFSASAERIVVLCGACAMCAAGLIVALSMRDVTRTREGRVVVGRSIVSQQELLADSFSALDVDDNELEDAGLPASYVKPSRWKTWRASLRVYWRATFGTRVFWQIVLFVLIVVFSRQIFRQLDTTLPLWSLRVLGADAPIGALYAVNPTIVVFAAPLFSLVFSRFDLYWVIVGGSLISAVGILGMAGHPSVAGSVVSLSIFTVGEAIYSPHVSTVVMSLAPDNYEGAYVSLSNSPLFLSKILVGFMGGEMLSRLCPRPLSDYDAAPIQNFATDTSTARITTAAAAAAPTLVSNGTLATLANSTMTTLAPTSLVTRPLPTITRFQAERQCARVWLIIGLVAFLTPILLTMFSCCINTRRVKNKLSVSTHGIKMDAVEEYDE